MSNDKFIEPKLIKPELIQEMDMLVDQLRDLTSLQPKTTQDAQMDARLADFLELAEQDFIRGWTDWEEGIQHKKGQSEAYNAGYADCYEYENRGGQ
jgi:hypothetical protein